MLKQLVVKAFFTQQVEVTISNSQVSHESYSRNHNHRNRIIIPQQNNQVQFNAARFITHPTQEIPENYINTEWYINGVAMESSVDTNISKIRELADFERGAIYGLW
nr:15404_t:CDS:2 [Entrophospora candida]